MDEKDASLKKMKEGYEAKAKAMNEQSDASLAKVFESRGEDQAKKIAEAEAAADAMVERVEKEIAAAFMKADAGAFDAIRATYVDAGVRK